MIPMEDWPDQAQDDTNRMMEYVGPYAQEQTARDGFLVPCGVGVSQDGALEPFIVDSNGFDSIEAAYQFMLNAVSKNEAGWRAVCLASVVTDETHDDAVRFIVEHVGGLACGGVMGFRRRRRTVTFDELIWMPIEPTLWSHPV
ncbi:MAG: hypothetical protein FWF75_10345 [Propionibacteriaceae bacterium]|nr:hypothetical protein [Propionibacteriaceae bacterium]